MAQCGVAVAQTANISVDASAPRGAPSPLLASNVWIVGKNDLRNRYYVERFFADQQPRVIQYTMSFDIFLQDTRSLEDYLERLDRLLLREDTVPKLLMEKIRAADARLVAGFEPYAMPKWLSSRPGDDRQAFVKEQWWTIERVSPPRDYAAAGRLVAETLRFLRERVGIRNLGWYVGHEPETQWLGDEASLFRYYEAAARAAKAVDPEIKVGGIGSYNGIQGTKAGCDDPHFTPATQQICRSEGGWANPAGSPLTQSFIIFAAKNAVPLDFINWHAFGSRPPNKHQADARLLRNWLQLAQLKNVKLYPSDWTYWAGAYPADYLDTQEAAAYVISSLYFMAKGGVGWHGHDFNIEVAAFEQQRAEERFNGEFIGDWPLMTRRGVIKPVYNAFRALTMLTSREGQPRMLAARVEGAPDVGAFSTHRNDGIYVLISNYVAAPSGPLSVTVKVNGLPFDPASEARAFWINGQRANACAANKKTESQPTDLPCGLGGVIDQAVAPVIELAEQARMDVQGGGAPPTGDSALYQSARQTMDTINSRSDVSLRASRNGIAVNGDRSLATLQLQMTPNSVVLLVLSPR